MEPLDPNCTRLRPLSTYADRLPSGRRGKRLNRATLWRWALRGLRDRPRLRTAALGGTRVTCDTWVWEFLNSDAVGRRVPVGGGLDRRERERVGARLGVVRPPGEVRGPARDSASAQAVPNGHVGGIRAPE